MSRNVKRSSLVQELTFFPRNKQSPGLRLTVCPRCGNKMAVSKGMKADVVVCTGYPECKEARIQ